MKITGKSGIAGFLRRFGVAAFAFFLVKGILWLLAPLLIIWFA